jgi:AcrR family transcriptional regulator
MNPSVSLSKGEQTRRKILARALDLAGEVGLEGLSIGALAEEAKLSKSGLFAHFKSKEILQLELLQEVFARFSLQVLQPSLMAARGEPRVRSVFDHYLHWIRGDEGQRGCLFQKFSSEYADRPGAVRDALMQSLKDWREFLGRVVQTAVEEGHFQAELDIGRFIYEFVGIAMVYQQAHRFVRDPRALERANEVFEALVIRSRA